MSCSTNPSNTSKEPDKAGGEVVFSSDGMDPVPLVRPPPTMSLMGGDDKNNNAFLEEDGVDVYQALVSVFASQQHQSSTRERLIRIQQELNTLELDVDQEALLRSQIAQLQERLLRQHQMLQGVVEKEDEPPMSDLDGLLLRLERAVGSMNVDTSTANTTNSQQRIGLLERVSALEEAMNVMNDSKLEAVGAKVKVIRQDLEAATKAKTKLHQQIGSGDNKVIGELYDALCQLAPMQSHLPILAQRLESLSTQHVQMASWSSRLQAVETSLRLLEQTVSSAEASVERLGSSWKTTIAPQLEANLKALDERLEQLNKKK